MCGIVGYIGSRNATEVLIEGLSKLEYRGYDSAGVALAARAMWERGECVPPAALLPDYHRLSQAERERAEREKTEGKQNEV